MAKNPMGGHKPFQNLPVPPGNPSSGQWPGASGKDSGQYPGVPAPINWGDSPMGEKETD